ncbi:hypothetical protein MLD38_020261 [Melastoma candidum]|uniref:Uncharacterized protein n=1 Tax=Melastoma candidum TaxID=119954 RepID=A0ACB9QFD8_9MYRT|nr:hypothetical protein MLD38_020261 [Melastoma candidum]
MRSTVSEASRLWWVVIIFAFFPARSFSAEVMLGSIEIFTTHEWFKSKPAVYFRCKGENQTDLPDVKAANVIYIFKGQESWQPLTNLPGEKCKRCGFYEKDTVQSDDVFAEWEFCSSDFTSNGRYTRVEHKEFNATFLCPDCVPLPSEPKTNHAAPGKHRGMPVVLIIIISAAVSTVFIAGLVVAYKYWKKKRREHEQARFLKLFEDDDDIEDELGLGTVI